MKQSFRASINFKDHSRKLAKHLEHLERQAAEHGGQFVEGLDHFKDSIGRLQSDLDLKRPRIE